MSDTKPKYFHEAVNPLLLQRFGHLQLTLASRADYRDEPPTVTIGILGGSRAMEQASDDDIVGVMGAASKLAAVLRDWLPPRWKVKL